jgi:hypothetical protein
LIINVITGFLLAFFISSLLFIITFIFRALASISHEDSFDVMFLIYGAIREFGCISFILNDEFGGDRFRECLRSERAWLLTSWISREVGCRCFRELIFFIFIRKVSVMKLLIFLLIIFIL